MEIHVLPIVFSYLGQQQVIYPVLIEAQSELVLVDCGYAGFLPLIENAAADIGIELSELTGIILTHHDVDHIGAAFEFKEKFSSIKFYASGIEADYISGRKKSVRLQQAEDIYESLSEEYKPGAKQFQKSLELIKPVAINEILDRPHAKFPLSNDLQVIPTPGHTPGHISLYDKKTKTLIAADAVVVENGELDLANPQFTLDLPAAIASVKKLIELAIEKLICYHGGIVENDISNKLQGLVNKYSKI